MDPIGDSFIIPIIVIISYTHNKHPPSLRTSQTQNLQQDPSPDLRNRQPLTPPNSLRRPSRGIRPDRKGILAAGRLRVVHNWLEVLLQ